MESSHYEESMSTLNYTPFFLKKRHSQMNVSAFGGTTVSMEGDEGGEEESISSSMTFAPPQTTSSMRMEEKAPPDLRSKLE